VVGGLRTLMTRIAMLAGVLKLLLGPPKLDRLKDRDQTKQQHGFYFSYFTIFPLLYFPIILLYYFSFFDALLVRI